MVRKVSNKFSEAEGYDYVEKKSSQHNEI